MCIRRCVKLQRCDNDIYCCSCSKMSASYVSLESAMIKFLSRCCWCHLENQKLLAKFLTEVISQQRITSSKCELERVLGITNQI